MGMPPYPALTIATWFISRASAEEQEPSTLNLHTLLGRAQGHYRARYGRPLLAEPVPADLPRDPVAQPTEPAASRSGACLTGPEADGAIAGHDIDPATARFLGEVWDGYGGCFADVKLVIPAACTAG